MYELFYFIPWPYSQNVQSLDPGKLHWVYSDIDYPAGCFVEKDWWDSIPG